MLELRPRHWSTNVASNCGPQHLHSPNWTAAPHSIASRPIYGALLPPVARHTGYYSPSAPYYRLRLTTPSAIANIASAEPLGTTRGIRYASSR